jgi:hypothetical protein
LKRKTKLLHFNLHDVKQGSVYIRRGTFTPESLELESEEVGEGWDRVRNSEAGGLDLALRGVGWHMMYIANRVHGFAFGPIGQNTIRTAAASLLRKLRPQMFNSVEIISVTAHHFAGVPYVHVSGCARHIQESGEIASFITRRNEITRTARQSRFGSLLSHSFLESAPTVHRIEKEQGRATRIR